MLTLQPISPAVEVVAFPNRTFKSLEGKLEINVAFSIKSFGGGVKSGS